MTADLYMSFKEKTQLFGTHYIVFHFVIMSLQSIQMLTMFLKKLILVQLLLMNWHLFRLQSNVECLLWEQRLNKIENFIILETMYFMKMRYLKFCKYLNLIPQGRGSPSLSKTAKVNIFFTLILQLTILN